MFLQRKSLSNIALVSAFVCQIHMAEACDEDYIDEMGDIIQSQKRDPENPISRLPTAIPLAQAILETGNGKSSAARRRNNHFGLTQKGRTIAFATTGQGVNFYLNNLSANPAYDDFRAKLARGESRVNVLVDTLADDYAEDPRYAQKLKSVIKTCQLAQRFDG